MAKDTEIRGPVGDWDALRCNPDYREDWWAYVGALPVM